MTDTLKSIAVYHVFRDREFIIELVRRLRERDGSAVHMYVTQRDQVEYYRRNAGVGLFDSINFAGHTMPLEFGRRLDEEKVVETARRHEARYGVTINKLVVGNRHFGRGYALAAPYHPRSRQSEKVGYIEMLDAYNRMFEFWEREVESKGITLALNVVSSHDCWVLRSLCVPIRSLVNATTKNRHMWAHDEFQSNPNIEKAYHAITETLPPIARIEVPRAQAELEKIFMPEVTGFSGFARTCLRQAKAHAWWRLKGIDKGKMYYLSSEMRMAYRRWRDHSHIRSGRGMKRLADLTGKQFVYFPLSVEPEIALMVGSPEYFYQHAAIAAVSRDLPAGVYLAVKEHVLGIGRRPSTFYQQLRDLKNVVLLDLSTPGVEVIREAEAVVTIRSSSGHEAAMLGKPVITFGRRNTYDFLPHVHLVTDEAELPRVLGDIVEGNFDIEQARQDGARFQQALIDVSFEYGASWRGDPSHFDEATVERVYAALLASLVDGPMDTSAPVEAA